VVAALIRRFFMRRSYLDHRGLPCGAWAIHSRTFSDGPVSMVVLGHPTNTRATVVHNSDLLSRLAGRAELCIVSPPEPGRPTPP
jgi:hypothetical protein